MHVWRQIWASVFGVCTVFQSTHAHSQERNHLNYLSLVENPQLKTPSHRVHSLSTFDLTFNLHRSQQRIKLSLEPNNDIIHEDAFVQYLDPYGNVKKTEKIQRADHKVFKGLAWTEDSKGSWIHVGSARIVVRRDGDDPLFEGGFTIMRDHHHIQLRSNYMRTKHEDDPSLEDTHDEFMVMFRDSDVAPESGHHELKRSSQQGSTCAADKLSFNMLPSHPVYSKVLKRDHGVWGTMSLNTLLGKRQIDSGTSPGGGNSAGVKLESTIGQSAGCPNTRMVALVGVATDCTYTSSFNSTESVRHNVITQMNTASNLYEKSFNITLGLRNLTVSDSVCPGSEQTTTPWNSACANNITIQDRLNQFSQWRGDRQDTNAYWMLLTTCNTDAEVGLAWLGQACISTAQTSQDTTGAQEYVTGANVVARTSTEWQVMAHEGGHIFGAVHDCDSTTCADGTTVNAQQCCPLSSTTCDAQGRYIMNPSTGAGITDFSPCTIGNICSALGRNSVKSDCLAANRGVVTISGSQCGNGIVEQGEECDCGGVESCGNNTCCDATTCQFKNNAVCDDSNEDCCTNCQLSSSDTVCRPSTSGCDPEEKCSGTASICPKDQTAPNGQKCGNSTAGLQCASGQCTSRDLQCKTLMGSITKSNDTYACDDSNCQLSCASPEFGPGTCYGMQQNFLDGTTCGGGGRCNNGQCQGSNGFKEIGSWIDRHRGLVIGVAAAIGGVLLLSLLSCIWKCCTHRKTPARKHHPRQWTPGRGPPMGSMPGGWGNHPQDNWQPPPPAYGGPSVRYA